MGLSFLAFGLVLAWLLIHRYRVELLEDRNESGGFALALEARRAEAAPARPVEPAAASHHRAQA